MSPPARPNPAGALCYILDDENRTRRLRSILLPVALVILALVLYPPAAAVLGIGVGGRWAWQAGKRG